MNTFSLKWESYERNVCSGFCALQQAGDFVDMTLAADGYHVKVHQSLLSLASPYFKDILKSLTSPHPVIFITNINHEILSLILEYIYTGEVKVAKNKLEEFIKSAKMLKIKGLVDFVPLTGLSSSRRVRHMPISDSVPSRESDNEQPEINRLPTSSEATNDPIDNLCTQQLNTTNVILNSDIVLSEPVQEPTEPMSQTAMNIIIDPFSNTFNVERTNYESGAQSYDMDTNNETPLESQEPFNYSNGINTNSYQATPNFPIASNAVVQSQNEDWNIEDQIESASETLPDGGGVPLQEDFDELLTIKKNTGIQIEVLSKDKAKETLKQYTVTAHGRLQMILNRFIFNVHHSAKCGKIRRWRCKDYRRKKCPALVDTSDEVILRRAYTHTHPNHDDNIVEKYKKFPFFNTIGEAKIKANIE